MVQSLNDGENGSNGSKICLLLLTSRTKRGKALFYFIMLKKRCVTSSRLCRRAEMILKRQKRNLLSTSTPKRMSSMKLATFSKRNRIHGESMNAYHSRLRQLASTCEFANIDKEIKSQIIQPCSSQALAANLQQSDFTSLSKDRQMSSQALSKSLLMSVINWSQWMEKLRSVETAWWYLKSFRSEW